MKRNSSHGFIELYVVSSLDRRGLSIVYVFKNSVSWMDTAKDARILVMEDALRRLNDIIGNRKLKLRSSSGIAARFELQRGEQITVSVNPTAFERLKNELLSENVPPKEVRKLAHLVASMPEEELFIIRRR